MVATHLISVVNPSPRRPATRSGFQATDPISVYTSRLQPNVSYYDVWQLPADASRLLLYLSFVFIIIGLLINVRH